MKFDFSSIVRNPDKVTETQKENGCQVFSFNCRDDGNSEYCSKESIQRWQDFAKNISEGKKILTYERTWYGDGESGGEIGTIILEICQGEPTTIYQETLEGQPYRKPVVLKPFVRRPRSVL